MNKMQNLLSKINWKSKKTIAAVTVAAAVLFAALTGVTALTVRHLNTEPAAKTTLPFAEEVTAAEVDELSATAENAADAANTAPVSTTTPAKVSGATNSKASGESNKSTGSKTTGKTGGLANSGSASHSSGTNSKPVTGSNSSNNSSAKPSGGSGGSTAKPTTTKPVTTTQPAKKEFAMTKQEIIDYASNYIESTYHCTYLAEFNKNNAGYNAPTKVFRSDSTEVIKQALRWAADATYGPGAWYKVYVEQIDENTMRVYMFYG